VPSPSEGIFCLRRSFLICNPFNLYILSFLVAILFEPLLDIGLAHPDGATDPYRGYGVLRDKFVGESPADAKQLAKVGDG
jgi:hypothetical protein